MIPTRINFLNLFFILAYENNFKIKNIYISFFTKIFLNHNCKRFLNTFDNFSHLPSQVFCAHRKFNGVIFKCQRPEGPSVCV
jgi:hypothetical protein